MGWSGAGSDADAIHDNVAGEIAAIVEKAAPVDADKVLLEDSAAGDAKVYAELGNLPGGGGGGGSGVTEGWSPLLDIKPGAADTPDDDFDAVALDGKWTAVSGSSGTVDLLETGEVEKYDLTTRPGWLLMQAGSAANQKVELRQDFTLGDGESIILAIALTISSDGQTGIANNELWCGITLNNNDAGYDAGEWNGLFLDSNVDGWRLIHYDGSSFHGSTAGASGASGSGSPIAELSYLRFVRSGSTVTAFWSHDGASWMALGGETRAATATNVWIFCESVVAASEPVPIVAVDWIRQGTNSIDPWDAASSISVIGDGAELTIAAGVIEVTSGFHTVDTQADGATDDLDTINGGSVGHLLVLKSADDARDPTVKDATGNILLASSTDFTLSDTDDTIMLIYDGTNWLEVSRSDNS